MDTVGGWGKADQLMSGVVQACGQTGLLYVGSFPPSVAYFPPALVHHFLTLFLHLPVDPLFQSVLFVFVLFFLSQPATTAAVQH